jgi:ABC-type phosphonate transport system ATPase subunit
MNTIIGRDAEKQLLWRMLTRYCGGVLGYYGMSGIGKTALLMHFEDEIRTQRFTPYVARLDFADTSLHDPAAAFINLIT